MLRETIHTLSQPQYRLIFSLPSVCGIITAEKYCSSFILDGHYQRDTVEKCNGVLRLIYWFLNY